MSSAGMDCPLQRAGHGQYFTDPEGNWYMAHLCARPLEGKWSILGRECAIQNIVWPAGQWPRLAVNEDKTPSLSYDVPETQVHSLPEENPVLRFASDLPKGWMTLRKPWRECIFTCSS